MKLTFFIGALLIAAGGVLFYILSPRTTIEPPSIQSSSKIIAENLIQTTASQIKEDIQSSGAQLTLVNLWASWCEPCKEEFPYLLKLRDKYEPQGFSLVLVSADTEDAVSDALAFLKSQNVTFPSYIKGEQDMDFISGIYPEWSGALPASILFDEKGEAVEYWQGAATFEEFETLVLKHLPKGKN